jgi:hypothetical protein
VLQPEEADFAEELLFIVPTEPTRDQREILNVYHLFNRVVWGSFGGAGNGRVSVVEKQLGR